MRFPAWLIVLMVVWGLAIWGIILYSSTVLSHSIHPSTTTTFTPATSTSP